MSRIVYTAQSDYKIKVQTGGTITLDTGATVLSATNMSSGQEYTILSLGTTNFALYGCLQTPAVGVTFKATGPGTGSGTVTQPAGNVIVIGNLEVKGITTTVQSTNTVIADNVLRLNDGQAGNGISAALNYESGIEIGRGNRPDAQLVFNEQVTHYNPVSLTATATSVVDSTITLSSTADISEGSEIVFRAGSTAVFGGVLPNETNPTKRYYVLGKLPGNKITISESRGGVLFTGLLNRSGNMKVLVTGQPGSWVAKTATGFLTGIATNSITVDSDLTKQTDLVFDLQNGVKKLRVANSTDYWSRVTEDDDIPNYKFIQQYILSTFPQTGGQGVAIVDRIYKGNLGSEFSQALATNTSLDFKILGSTRANITANGLTVDFVNVFGNQITNNNSNLVLTAGNLNVEIDGVLNLQDQLSDPTQVSGYTKMYSKSNLTGLAQTPGRTGIFFRNAVNNQDELVSKNRALLFSILF